MNIWTSKGLFAGAFLALAGCNDASLKHDTIDLTEPQALTSAKLGRGQVTLVPPDGFCIDKNSLRPQFALMARCDTLGAQANGVPARAVITATTTKRRGDAVLSLVDLGVSDEQVLARADTDTLLVVQIEGIPPDPALHTVFWRAVGQIGDQVIGLSLYEASGAPDIGSQAPALLEQIMQRSRNKTVPDAP